MQNFKRALFSKQRQVINPNSVPTQRLQEIILQLIVVLGGVIDWRRNKVHQILDGLHVLKGLFRENFWHVVLGQRFLVEEGCLLFDFLVGGFENHAEEV